MTYARLLDDVGNFEKKLLAFLGILAPHEDLYREFVALDLVEILGYVLWSGLTRPHSRIYWESAPFFWVVRM